MTTDFFDPGYVTYRLLQLPDDERSNRRRKVAKLLQPYPSAIQFAEQLSQVRSTTRVQTRYGDQKQEKMKIRELHRVQVRVNLPSGLSTWDSGSNFTVNINVGGHWFDAFYVETDRGVRKITSADILMREEYHVIYMKYPERFSADAHSQTSFYLPWWHANEPNSAGINMMSMLFRDPVDADKYAAWLLQNRSNVKHMSLDNYLTLI